MITLIMKPRSRRSFFAPPRSPPHPVAECIGRRHIKRENKNEKNVLVLFEILA
jgi:hypothetical protein